MPALTSLVNPASAVITNSASQPVPTTVSDATVALEEIAFYLGKLVKMSESLAVVDTSQRQRVVIENATTVSNFPVVVRDNGNSNVFTQPGAGTNAAPPFSIWGGIPDAWRQVEAARQNYQLSIRSNLQFT